MPCLICSWLQNSIRASAATAWALFLEWKSYVLAFIPPSLSHRFRISLLPPTYQTETAPALLLQASTHASEEEDDEDQKKKKNL
jgi:hypothetical protein